MLHMYTVRLTAVTAHIFFLFTVNKHKPWIETSYHGVITENTDIVLLDPPLVALDKDAPIPYAGMVHLIFNMDFRWMTNDHRNRDKGGQTQIKTQQSTMTLQWEVQLWDVLTLEI